MPRFEIILEEFQVGPGQRKVGRAFAFFGA
jgi:hypothetical protein